MSISINFIKRAVTGILFVAVMVGCILYNPLSFGVLFTIISALSVIEFGGLINANTDANINRPINAMAAVYLFVAFMSFATSTATAGIFVPYLLMLLVLFISELYLKHSNPVGNWSYSMLSQLYIGLPFALLNVIAFQNDAAGTVTYNPIIPLSIFIFLWISDSGAYCVGSLIGKNRLFERISPKKSWEGSIGGGLLTIAISIALFYVLDSFGMHVLSIWQWAGLAAVVVVFGTWGDLTESLLKRQLGVKDSGNLLPGHGGMLDRFDSSLMAIPAAAAYLYFIAL